MRNEKIDGWVCRSNNKKILYSFSEPITPTQAIKELGVKKFNLKPFLKRGLVKCLNPEARKGKLYFLTNKAKQILGIPISFQNINDDYNLIGWIKASPKQRYVILKTLSLNSTKNTSEEIRLKSSKLNPCLSRISTKSVLEELVDKELIDTEMGKDRKRYYWVNETGKMTMLNLNNLER